MSKKLLSRAALGVLLAPGLVCAGYPDVKQDHWAHQSVAKSAQLGLVKGRADGKFHGDKAATRYELAQGLAKSMAEMENRLAQEGHNPQDIVPYVERINLYVADEIDHLKQEQKELRAEVKEIMARLDRLGGSAWSPAPHPTAPMIHPHKSTVPHTELEHSKIEKRWTRQSAVPAPLGAPQSRMPHDIEGAAVVGTPQTKTPSDAQAWQEGMAPSGITEVGPEGDDEEVVTPEPTKTSKSRRAVVGPAKARPAPSRPSMDGTLGAVIIDQGAPPAPTSKSQGKGKSPVALTATPSQEAATRVMPLEEIAPEDVAVSAGDPSEEELAGKLAPSAPPSDPPAPVIPIRERIAARRKSKDSATEVASAIQAPPAPASKPAVTRSVVPRTVRSEPIVESPAVISQIDRDLEKAFNGLQAATEAKAAAPAATAAPVAGAIPIIKVSVGGAPAKPTPAPDVVAVAVVPETPIASSDTASDAQPMTYKPISGKKSAGLSETARAYLQALKKSHGRE